MMKMSMYKAGDRGSADFGWFKAKYSFSFGEYYNPEKLGFGALRVFNDSVIRVNKGFAAHPHKNFEIITVQLQGKLSHTDEWGTRILQANDVQVISAGSGVTHSDLNIGYEEAKQLQIWLLPEKQNIEPVSNIESFDLQDRQEKWQTLISPVDREESRLKIKQQAWISRGEFKAKQTIDYRQKKNGNGLFLFIIKGSININKATLHTRDAITLTQLEHAEIVIQEDADLLVIDTIM